MMTKNSKISRNEQVKQEIFLTAKRPSFTTDANGRLLPISYMATDKLPDITPNYVQAQVQASNKKKKSLPIIQDKTRDSNLKSFNSEDKD